MLEVVSESADLLLLEDVKNHLIVEHTEDDVLIQLYIDNSLNAVEKHLHKKVSLIDYKKTLVNWDSTIVWESVKPLGDIVITYNTSLTLTLKPYDYNYDRDNDTNYYEYIGNDTIRLTFNDIPSVWDENSFEATYSTGSDGIEGVVTQARLLLIGTWYEQRASVKVNPVKVLEVPHTVEFLLSPYQDSPL